MKRLALLLGILAFVPGLAYSQEGVTVSELLAEGWTVEGVIMTNAGPGILLEKESQLTMCFVAETPGSAAITTQYCKPVE